MLFAEQAAEEKVSAESSPQLIDTETDTEPSEADRPEENEDLRESPDGKEIDPDLGTEVEQLPAEEVDSAKAEPVSAAEKLEIGKRILGLRRPPAHPTWTAVDILANESAFRDAQAHALSSLNKEVAGVLIGPQPEKQQDGRYVVHVADTLIAKHTRMHGASVTYTPESWRYVNDRLEELYPEGSAVIVGWYHTHPGFGIFLSGMDLFIHQNFFTQKWHIALVLDPLSQRSGFFCWDREKKRVDSYDFPWPKWASGSW
jgi:proteasome lid subunit RPN8/RPN11